jgi:hypothetical protein
MARNIHASRNAEDVMKDLQNKNVFIMEISLLRSRKDRTPLPLYMLTFEKNEDIKRIFEINEMLSLKVTIEALRGSKLIPQCKSCQACEHTQKYCRKEARYKKVPKTRAKPPKIALIVAKLTP